MLVSIQVGLTIASVSKPTKIVQLAYLRHMQVARTLSLLRGPLSTIVHGANKAFLISCVYSLYVKAVKCDSTRYQRQPTHHRSPGLIRVYLTHCFL